MVNLCDVGRVFAITSRDFSCVLPEVLTRKKRKRVRCLKKEFRFLAHPRRLGVKKHRSKIDNQSWEVSTPTNSCASFSSGGPPSGATGRQCVSGMAADGCVSDCDGCPDGKRRQVDVDRVADGAPCICNGDAGNIFPEMCEGTPSLERRVPPIILRRVGVNGCGCRSENSGLSLDEGEEGTNDSEAEADLPESFSCQRTQAYAFFYQSSCARVCKTWPFPRSGPPDELKSLSRSGRRWIVTSSLPATPATPSHIPENDVQDELCKEALEPQAVSSMSGEKLESNRSVQRAFEEKNDETNDPEAEVNLPESVSCQRTQALFYQSSCSRVCKTWPFPRSGPPDELRSSLCRGRRWIVTSSFPATPTTPTRKPDVQDKLCKEALEAQAVPCVSGEAVESNQSAQRAFEDSSHVPEFLVCAENKQVDNELTHVLNSKRSSPKSQPTENQSILDTPGRKAVSFSIRLDIPVIASEDSTSPSSSKCTQITICPVSRTPSVSLVDDQEEIRFGVGALYNSQSLSELCLKVETLKSQCPSASTSHSAAEQGPQKPITHTLNSKPPYWGKRKRRRFENSTVTDSSSDENERDSNPSSDEEPVERDDTENSRFNDVTSQTEDKGAIELQSAEDSTVPNGFLDVSRAYEEDVLILDVIQDDPDLFGAVVAETVNKPGTLAEDDGEARTKRQTGNLSKIVWDLDTDR